jgi:hypothetical protein
MVCAGVTQLPCPSHADAGVSMPFAQLGPGQSVMQQTPPAQIPEPHSPPSLQELPSGNPASTPASPRWLVEPSSVTTATSEEDASGCK